MAADVRLGPVAAVRSLKSHAQPLRLRLDGKDKLSSRPIFIGFAIMSAGLIITLLPVRLDEYGLGDLTDGTGHGYVPALSFLAGDACLAAAARRAVEAARGRPLERVVIFILGAVTAALTARSLRIVTQLMLLRDFYRPALFFTGDARGAVVGWGIVLAFALLAGFLAPVAVGLAALVPVKIAKAVPPLHWLAERRSCLLWPFLALAAVVIVTQWVLPAGLASAMGYRYLAPSGSVIVFSLRDLGPSAWASLQILFALPLVVLMWEGIEWARSFERLVRTREGGPTRLLKTALRVDVRIAIALAVLGCGALAVAQHRVLACIAATVLISVVALSFTGRLGRAGRLFKSFELGVRQWQLPEDWREVGRFSLVLAVLVAPPLGLLLRDLGCRPGRGGGSRTLLAQPPARR